MRGSGSHLCPSADPRTQPSGPEAGGGGSGRPAAAPIARGVRPGFVRSPGGNGVTERLMRTLKEQLLRIRDFRTVEDLHLALLAFQRTYDESWILARQGDRTPNQARAALVAAAWNSPVNNTHLCPENSGRYPPLPSRPTPSARPSTFCECRVWSTRSRS